ncbi:hypothetical protein Pst134EA_022951 [Puccinia striiformis f. sp. tritici]|uniref:hypothetical protein n=1 Tax=Puccinia striiformis f. sp. tritici TaxID=168172 RepID=UPI002008E343|nr:hypothetical protein Pst134EA_022951 [Puccinia striiformis f. sp. tritici]KAH9455488.1 hypothetical protein Pst134EA_022951 [Puccinia striiformis f. sp. tritici]
MAKNSWNTIDDTYPEKQSGRLKKDVGVCRQKRSPISPRDNPITRKKIIISRASRSHFNSLASYYLNPFNARWKFGNFFIIHALRTQNNIFVFLNQPQTVRSLQLFSSSTCTIINFLEEEREKNPCWKYILSPFDRFIFETQLQFIHSNNPKQKNKGKTHRTNSENKVPHHFRSLLLN